MGLSDSERTSMIRSAVLIQYMRVTDRQTDGRTDGQTELAWHIRAIAYMLSLVKKLSILVSKRWVGYTDALQTLPCFSYVYISSTLYPISNKVICVTSLLTCVSVVVSKLEIDRGCRCRVVAVERQARILLFVLRGRSYNADRRLILLYAYWTVISIVNLSYTFSNTPNRSLYTELKKALRQCKPPSGGHLDVRRKSHVLWLITSGCNSTTNGRVFTLGTTIGDGFWLHNTQEIVTNLITLRVLFIPTYLMNLAKPEIAPFVPPTPKTTF